MTLGRSVPNIADGWFGFTIELRPMYDNMQKILTAWMEHRGPSLAPELRTAGTIFAQQKAALLLFLERKPTSEQVLNDARDWLFQEQFLACICECLQSGTDECALLTMSL
jgi:hypothetical protein